MLTDRYGLSLSTASAAARDAYVQASDLALTFYPGAAEAYDRAIAADCGFALAHAGTEDGQLAAARAKIEQSLVANPNNAHGAHGFAHVCYESGELDAARTFLSTRLTAYPREGFFYGHLSWHLSLCEIQAGEWTKASGLYRDAIALDRHSGGPQ